MLPTVGNNTSTVRHASTEATVTLQRPQKRHLALGIEDSNALLICDSGEATTNKHLALSAEGGWKIKKICVSAEATMNAHLALGADDGLKIFNWTNWRSIVIFIHNQNLCYLS